jgi:hypothetical protein
MTSEYTLAMADPFFKILVVYRWQAPRFVDNAFFQGTFKERILGEFNNLVKQSTNEKVKTGFSFELVRDIHPLAGVSWDDLPKTLFRAHLVGKIDQHGLLAMAKKLAPTMDPKHVASQMNDEGGIGGRAQSGSSAAFASTTAFEADLLFDDSNPKLNAEAGRQLGGLVSHELGHAMGIPKNQGKGLMFGSCTVNLKQPSAISNSHFEPADIKIILATLEGIAKGSTHPGAH